MTVSSPTENERVWQSLLEDSPRILQQNDANGFSDIHAKEIKPYREPRLATKFDFKEDVPDVLTSQNLSVLAVRNGIYRIAPTNPFLEVRHSIDILDHIEIQIPDRIKTLTVADISSEANALDVAKISGILADVFDESSVELVIRSRVHCGAIRFRLFNQADRSKFQPYNPNGVQIEVDGGYEGERALHLVEAKLGSKRNNITIRQLLYPHLHYLKKHPFIKIYSYLMFYDKEKAEYTFYKFHTDEDRVHKVDHNDVRCYRLRDHQSSDFLQQLCRTPKGHDLIDLTTPFPQADRFATVYDIFLKLVRSRSGLWIEQIFSDYNLDRRQHDYYVNVLVWLKLAVKTDTKFYTPTQTAKRIARIKKRAETIFELAKIVVSNEIFNIAMRSRTENVPFESYSGYLAELLARKDYYRLKADTTINRRLKTVKSWVEFFYRELSNFKVS